MHSACSIIVCFCMGNKGSVVLATVNRGMSQTFTTRTEVKTMTFEERLAELAFNGWLEYCERKKRRADDE